MQLDWWTLLLQTVNVLILLWILSHFLFRPVARIIAERQAAAQAEFLRAKDEHAKAEAERETLRKLAQETASKRADILTRAEEEAKAQKKALLEDARVQADAAREATRGELERLRDAQARALSDAAGALATDIAARLLDRLPDEARITGFIEGLADAVIDLPESTRKGIGMTGPVPIRTARDLTAQEATLLKERLAQAVGHPLDITVTADTSLLAGLELDAPKAIVRNHLRADLDRIRQELDAHE